MPGEQFDIGAYIKLDGESQFKSAVTAVNNSMKGMKAELARVKEEYAGNLNSLEALSKKQEIFGRFQTELANKIERIKEGQRHANEVMADYQEKVATMNGKLEEARRRLNEMRSSGEHSADAIAAQEAEVQRLSDGMERANENLTRQQARVTGWGASLSRAETEQARLNNQIEANSRYLEEARRSADHHAHSIDENARVVRQTTEVVMEWGEALKTAVAEKAIDAGIDALKELGSAAMDTALETQKAENQIEASMEASAGSLERYKDVMKDIYANNYGDSMEDVGDAISSVAQVLGELSGTELQDVVESAFTLQDVFGMDMDETIRGAQSLMYQFGMTAEEAMDLIGSGAKQGLNYTDELGDNLSEYAGKFSQAGYSAQEYFQLLENGTSNGAYNLDKVNDAINEVTTRLADGTVEDALGSFSTGTQMLFFQWQQGGATQKQVIDSIVADIAGCQNQQEALNMAAQAFGTMAEDGNLQFISSLTSVGNAFDSVQGKMDEIKETKYDDLNSQITGLTRTIQMQLGAQIEKLLPVAAKGLETIADNLLPIETAVVGLGTSIAGLKAGKVFLQMMDAVKAYWLSLEGATAAQKALTMATKAMSFLSAHWGAIALGAAAAVAVYAAFSDTVKSTDETIRESQEAYEEFTDKIGENREAREKNIGSVTSEYSACASMVAQLYAMTDAERLSTDGKARAAAMVDTLNEKFDGLNLAIDETTGKLNMERDELDALVASMEKRALAEAAQDALKEVASEKIELLRQRQEAMDKVNELSAQHAAANDTEQRVISKSMLEQQEVIQGLNGQLGKNAEEFERLSGMAGEYTAAANKSAKATEGYAGSLDGVETGAEDAAGAVDEAAEAFNDLKESVADSIESSVNMLSEFSGGTEVTAEEIKKNLDSQIEGISGWADNMKTLAASAGQGMSQELYDALAEMGPQSANLVQTLVDTLNSDMENGTSDFGAICQKWADAMKLADSSDVIASYTSLGAGIQEAVAPEMEKTGKGMDDSAAEGVKTNKNAVTGATGGVMQESVTAANSYGTQFRQTGYNMMSGVAAGMHGGSKLVYDAVNTIMDNAKKEANKATDSHSPSRVWRNQVGAYMSQGLALGILDGKRDAMSASVELAKAALQGAKDELEINSPSKVFKKLGEYISQGLGVGIVNGKKYAVVQSKKMAKEVYEESSKWFKDYKKQHSVSLEDEKKFWKELARVVKKDGTSYGKARKSAAANDGFIKEVRKNTEKAFGTSWYTTKGKKTVKKDADDYYGDLTKAAKKYIDNKKATDNVSLQQEKYFWEQVKKSAGKGTQTYADASKKIKEINKSIKKDLASGETKADRIEYGVSGSALDLYKSLYKVSAKAEWQYWQRIRKSKGLTAEQKLEIDGKILEAKENYYEQMAELDDDYSEKCEEVNAKLEEDVKELTETYTDALADRKSAIKDSFSLFDEFKSEAEAPDVLLANMQSQVAGYALWMEQLEELEEKHILNDALLEELRQMGPEAAATIVSLNQMTNEQLKLVNEAYEEKDRLASAQAEKELETLRTETENKIQAFKQEAQKELDAYRTEYEKASAELSAAISAPLQELAEKATTLGENATAKLILGLKNSAESKETKQSLKEIQWTITDGLAKLPNKGAKIGKNTLAGILDGLSDKLEIQKGAKSFVAELEAAIKKEAGIASPSKRFRDVIGRQIPAGVGQGIEADTRKATEAGTGMVKTMLEQAAEQAKRQQEALSIHLAGINAGAGIEALNSLTSAPVRQAPNVTVNNTGVADMVGSMTAEIRALRGEIGRMKIMLDKDTLVGELAEPIGDELAMQAIRV